MERTTIPVAIAPGDAPWAEDAIRRGGGEPAGLDENPAGLVWTEPGATDELRGVLRAHPGISWVQLPMAGIERVAEAGVLDHQRRPARAGRAELLAEAAAHPSGDAP